mmetsp:Transcript_22846/g.39121  ORF Transcript_22846/g.39121 Transcript_22846/m.39121 type:complete len:224 (-) Transcript_22846:725-1396(-)
MAISFSKSCSALFFLLSNFISILFAKSLSLGSIPSISSTLTSSVSSGSAGAILSCATLANFSTTSSMSVDPSSTSSSSILPNCSSYNAISFGLTFSNQAFIVLIRSSRDPITCCNPWAKPFQSLTTERVAFTFTDIPLCPKYRVFMDCCLYSRAGLIVQNTRDRVFVLRASLSIMVSLYSRYGIRFSLRASAAITLLSPNRVSLMCFVSCCNIPSVPIKAACS